VSELPADPPPPVPALRAQAPDDPDVGALIRRLRRQRGMSVEELARSAALSPSFLRAVESGRSDIAYGRLSRIAHAFNLDVAGLLGYFSRGKPQVTRSDEHARIDRGPGVDYRRLRVPGVDFELVIVTFEPGTAFRDAISHPGIDIVHVSTGEIVVTYDDEDYRMSAGDTGFWSGGHPHTFRNGHDDVSQFVAVTTEIVF
jgi:transcriptional regulator with XRE-family HTH domain